MSEVQIFESVAIPWVVMQLILVAIVIFVPQTVTFFLDKEKVVDTDKVQLNFQKSPERSDDTPTEREDPSKNTAKPIL